MKMNPQSSLGCVNGRGVLRVLRLVRRYQYKIRDSLSYF